MTDTYLNLVNSGFTKTLAKQLGQRADEMEQKARASE